ncbi:MAG: hypothetical protein ACRETC_01890, partial [Gammaproteobacteria bacterium]
TAVTARSIGKLAALAADLRRSVSGFTLPKDEDESDARQSAMEVSNFEEESGSQEPPLVTAGSSL